MGKNNSTEQVSEQPLEERIEESVKSTESTTQTIFGDLDEVGKVVDKILADQQNGNILTEQLKNEIRKYKMEHDSFKIEVAKIIKSEIEKQIKPLVNEMSRMTKSKPRFIYIRPKFPFLNLFKKKND